MHDASRPLTALRCPKCAGDMAAYERSGVVIDQCRECRGIFLDRGELEKLADAEAAAYRDAAPAPVHGARGAWDGRRDRDDDDDRDDDRRRDRRDDRYDGRSLDPRYDPRYGAKPYRKRSFLGELLDFGD